MRADTPAAAELEIVVPARNEAQRLPGGLAVLSERLVSAPVTATVLVVDNASADATADVVRGWRGPVPVRLLRCPRPGKGAAVRTGLLATAAPYVGFCDADMATDLSVLDGVLRLLAAGEQVVVGSRGHPASIVEDRSRPVRKLGAIVFNRLCRDLTGGVSDTQCGFKFFAGPLARTVAFELRTTGFAFDAELLMRCVRYGARVHEVPVRWCDVPGSTFSMSRHAAGCLRDLMRIRAMAGQDAPPLPSLLAAERLRAG